MGNEYDVVKKSTRKCFAIYLALGIILIIASCFIYCAAGENTLSISITAKAQSNANALSNNVRFNRITLDIGTDKEREYELENIPITAPWQYDEENHLIYAYDISNPAKLDLDISGADTATINFISEIGSGMVEVSTEDNESELIDLYSSSAWSDVQKTYERAFSWVYVLRIAAILLAVIGAFVIIKKCICDNFERVLQRARQIRLKTIPFAVLSGIVLMLAYILLATALQSPLYGAVYKDKVTLTVEAVGQKSAKALATNARVSEISVNGVEYDFSKVITSDNWEYNSVNHLLDSMDSVEPQRFTVSLSNVRTIDITFVSEVGSGFVNVYIDGDLQRSIDLYKNAEWDYTYYQYEVSPLIRPYRSYTVLGLLFAAGFIIGLFTCGSKRLLGCCVFLAACFGFAIFVCEICVIVQNSSLFELFRWPYTSPENFWYEVALVSLLCIVLALLCGRIYISSAIIGITTTALLMINHYKLQFRDTPLLPWDFELAGEVASVVDGFKFEFSFAIFISFVLVIAATILLRLIERKTFEKRLRLRLRLPVALVAALLLGVYVSNNYISFSNGINLFKIKEMYVSEGFINSFVKCTRYLLPMEKPEGYNEQTMNAIADEIKASAAVQSDEKPNIILIMSESFWDIERIDKLKVNEQMFPTYRQLQAESVTGELLTNVFGGGTVNSEFEALTGFSVGYLPNEYMPYQRCMHNGMFSINSYLKGIGYDSTAIHPFEKNNYNRNMAYDYFGFDQKIWESDFDEDCDRMRGYVSDKALVERIISEYEQHNEKSDAPWFNLSVSMQNHGGYWGTSIDEGKELDIDVSAYNEDTQDSIRDMAIGLHYSDLALGELIDYFKTQDEPTIIIMFGDHMSDAGPTGFELMEQSGLSENDASVSNVYNRHRVPFMAWSNYKDVYKQCGILSVTQLLPTVLSEYDAPVPTYFSYLYSTQDIYKACASGLYVDSRDEVRANEDMTEAQKALYDKLWLIEYDYIYGKRYLSDIFDS